MPELSEIVKFDSIFWSGFLFGLAFHHLNRRNWVFAGLLLVLAVILGGFGGV